ncbi:MAG: RsmB/NOP family class I SAM-dependent RNA methyltransferase [Candidatus Hodarchaeota archaeon]
MTQRLLSEEFIERWEFFYGEDRVRTILANLKQKDPRILAPNTLKIQLSKLKLLLESKGFKLEQRDDFNILIIKHEPYNIVSTPEYLTGYFSIQSLTSLIPPKCLQLSPNSLVADFAASPGIKTCLLAQEMENHGTIIAIEKSKSRIPALKANLARMGVWNTIALNFDAILFPKLNLQANHILLDAPCSGTGLKTTKDKRIEPRMLKDIFRQVEKQKKLLESAWKQLKPNGTLVYSTCSLEPEEGEVQINDFLERHIDEAKLQPVPFNIGLPGKNTNWYSPLHHYLEKTRRIFPDIGCDGFFVAIVKKVLN